MLPTEREVQRKIESFEQRVADSDDDEDASLPPMIIVGDDPFGHFPSPDCGTGTEVYPSAEAVVEEYGTEALTNPFVKILDFTDANTGRDDD